MFPGDGDDPGRWEAEAWSAGYEGWDLLSEGRTLEGWRRGEAETRVDLPLEHLVAHFVDLTGHGERGIRPATGIIIDLIIRVHSIYRYLFTIIMIILIIILKHRH